MAALAKRGKRSKSSLKGASKQMAKSMSEKQFRDLAKTKRIGNHAGGARLVQQIEAQPNDTIVVASDASWLRHFIAASRERLRSSSLKSTAPPLLRGGSGWCRGPEYRTRSRHAE